MAEETAELEAEAASGDPARKPAVEAELGDLLFTVVNLGRHLGVDAEMALRECNLRFRHRFSEMELAAPRPLEELSPDELEALWAQAKRKLASGEASLRAPNLRAAKPHRRQAMIQIRSCAGFDEMEACVELQIETWGYDESDVIPRKAFLLAQKIGGQVIGAFDSELAGDCGRRRPTERWSVSPCLCRESKQLQNGPQPYLHSHMLAVRAFPPQSRPWRATQMGTTA